MRKFVTVAAAIAAFGFVNAASAADMPVKAPLVKAPVAVAAYNWTGLYIGGYVGGAWASGNAVSTDPCSPALLAVCAATGVGSFNGVAPTPYSLKGSFIGGGTLGYNMQSGMFVYGLEGELGYIHLHGSVIQDPLFISDTSAEATIGSWYGILAGRLGLAWDRTLIYVKGGGVAVRVSDGVIDNVGVTLDTRTATTRWGGAFGGGVEYGLTPNWRLKAEYQYLAIAFDHNTTGVTSTGFAEQVTTHIPNVHTVKFGINYAF